MKCRLRSLSPYDVTAVLQSVVAVVTLIRTSRSSRMRSRSSMFGRALSTLAQGVRKPRPSDGEVAAADHICAG